MNEKKNCKPLIKIYRSKTNISFSKFRKSIFCYPSKC